MGWRCRELEHGAPWKARSGSGSCGYSASTLAMWQPLTSATLEATVRLRASRYRVVLTRLPGTGSNTHMFSTTALPSGASTFASLSAAMPPRLRPSTLTVTP